MCFHVSLCYQNFRKLNHVQWAQEIRLCNPHLCSSNPVIGVADQCCTLSKTFALHCSVAPSSSWHGNRYTLHPDFLVGSSIWYGWITTELSSTPLSVTLSTTRASSLKFILGANAVAGNGLKRQFLLPGPMSHPESFVFYFIPVYGHDASFAEMTLFSVHTAHRHSKRYHVPPEL